MQIIPNVRFWRWSTLGDDTENKLQSSCYLERKNPPICPISEPSETKVPQNQPTFPSLYKIV